MNQETVGGAGVAEQTAASEPTGKQRIVRPIRGLWIWLRFSQLAFIVLEIALILSSAATIIFFGRVQSGYYETDTEIMQAGTVIDTISAPVGIAYFVVYVVCVISYARFFHRSMNNAKAAGASSAKMSPGWVWGYLFIPVLNLWKPLQGVMQVWRGSMERTGASPKVPATVGWWWATWLGTTIIGNISFRLAMQAGAFGEEITDFDLYLTTYYLDIISSVIGVACCILLLRFTSKLKDAQSAIEKGELAEVFE